MHLAGADFPMSRANALSVSGWRPLFEQAASRADEVQHGLRRFHRRRTRSSRRRRLAEGFAARRDPRRSVSGQRVLSRRARCPASSISPSPAPTCSPTTSRSASTPGVSRAIIRSTSPRRAPFSAPMAASGNCPSAEQDALPLLARGAALRFLLTRLVDFLNVPAGRAGAAEGSARICPQAALSAERRQHARLRRRRLGAGGVSALPSVIDPHRWRLLGQSRAGRLGRDPEIRRRRKGIEGRRGRIPPTTAWS